MRAYLVACLLTCGIAGCRTDDRTFAAGTGGSGTGGRGHAGDTGTGGEGGGGGNVVDTSCVDAELEADRSEGQDTRTAEDDFSLSCGSGSAPDLAFSWTAPATGYYTFSTTGSSFDTVVAVLDGCVGEELDCNNTFRSSPQAVAVARLTKDQRVIVVVDGYAGDRGDVVLNVAEVTCPSLDLTDQPMPVVLSTIGETDEHSGAASGYDCGGAGFLDKTIRWVAPSDGLYRFSADTVSLQGAVYLYEGAVCGGRALQCSRRGGHVAEVTRSLRRGEAVTVVVETDEEGSEFPFNVEKLEPEACGMLPQLQNLANVQLTSTTGTKELTASCYGAGNNYVGSWPEHAYRFTVDLGPLEGCNVDVAFEEGSIGGAVYLLPGTQCAGPELQCYATANGTGLSFFGASENGDYTLVIENHDPFDQTLVYSVTTDCLAD